MHSTSEIRIRVQLALRLFDAVIAANGIGGATPRLFLPVFLPSLTRAFNCSKRVSSWPIRSEETDTLCFLPPSCVRLIRSTLITMLSAVARSQKDETVLYPTIFQCSVLFAALKILLVPA